MASKLSILYQWYAFTNLKRFIHNLLQITMELSLQEKDAKLADMQAKLAEMERAQRECMVCCMVQSWKRKKTKFFPNATLRFVFRKFQTRTQTQKTKNSKRKRKRRKPKFPNANANARRISPKNQTPNIIFPKFQCWPGKQNWKFLTKND